MSTITCASFNHTQFLSLTNWHCAHQRWNSYLNQFCYGWFNTCSSTFLMLHNSRICCLRCNSNQRKELLWLTPHLSILLAIEVFGCLHKHANAFLHDYANVIWSLKEPKGPPLFVLVTFLCQRISNMLQRMQTSFILTWTMVLDLTTSQLQTL